ncbi:hypothetical protein RN001_014710 [Aquatica leii]|uniref:G-protein coupled receptors family 2 profile 2 domain-containing protein n=1 Tax=Aquatica leii TaxID=1421715 RepID=A0AAN7NZZ1_9COLE|nr:hypothetical protein RN001_014710 [Aquatica leii]
MASVAFLVVIVLNTLQIVLSECDTNNNDPEDDAYAYGTYVYNGTISACNCTKTKICVRKCCHLNYVLIDKLCVRNSTLEFKVDVFDDTVMVNDVLDFRYLPGRMICDSGSTYYRLEPIDFPEDQFYMQRDGRLWQPLVNKHIASDRYCLERFDDIGISAFACFDAIDKVEKKLNTLGMMISMPFLLATFIVYALLPERNIHGKSLMCYVITLFGAYFFLVIMQQHTNVVGPGCTTLGTFCLFFFMVSFLWMNVMSVDIWWTFKVEHKRFLLYSAYTWGVSLLFVIIVTIINQTSPLSAWYKPGIGDGQCWFTIGMPTLIYFYGPLALIIVVNIVLFGRTAWRIKMIQQDTTDKQRFYLYLKLFMAMGVNWSMEVISWVVDWQVEEVYSAVWILTDLCNALYGVFIFFIFVFKRPIWNLLKKRYYLAIGKIQLARTIRASDATSTTMTAISLCQRTTMK